MYMAYKKDMIEEDSGIADMDKFIKITVCLSNLIDVLVIDHLLL